MTALDEARAHLAKDAVCLKLTGRTGKSENHVDVVRELSKAGPAGAEMQWTPSRLLKGKVKSQHQAACVLQVETANAIRWAERLYEQALRVVTSDR